VAAVVGFLTALPLLGLDAWLLELLVSFRVHILIGLVLVALLALIRRFRWIAACLAIAALVNAGDVAATFLGSAQMLASEAVETDDQALKVLFANVQMGGDNPGEITAEIERLDPDVIVLAEATPALDAALGDLSARYPNKISEPRQHPFGMILLSKWPFDEAGTDIVMLPRPTEWEIAPPVAIVARIETATGPVTVIGLHPFPPLMGQAFAVRNYQLDVMADVIAQQPPPVIALGDLNATPWSPTLRRFMKNAGLQGPNILATWPVALGPAGLPLDHILLSRDLTFRRIERGGDVGSDHRPVFAVVAMDGVQGSPGTP